MTNLIQPPEGWVETPRCGDLCFGRFLPMKAPLDEKFGVPPQKTWSVGHALSATRAVRVPLGVVIDLSSGKNFYSRTSSPWGAVPYHHIRCLSDGDRDEPPSDEAWHEFFLAIDAAERRSGGARFVTVVHCTHGYNRTGYMLVRWAVTTGVSPDVQTALDEFARARPPGIYKPQFVTSLFIAFGLRPPQRGPTWPEWRRRRRNEREAEIGEFWARVAEDAPPPLPHAAVRDICWSHDEGVMLRHARRSAGNASASATAQVLTVVSTACRCEHLEFGGAQPVALDRGSLALLRTDYLVSWKADGVRLLVAVLRHGTFGVNRRMEVRDIGDIMQGATAEERRALCPMVFDAELVVKDGRRHLWVHDLLMLSGEPISPRPFVERVATCKRVHQAHFSRFRSGVVVGVKGWWNASRATQVWDDPLNDPKDGLVFAPKYAPYTAGRDLSLFKWKKDNTADFRVDARYDLYLADGSKPPVGVLLNREERWRDEVVEAIWDYERSGWVALHVRNDKLRPNSRDTFDGTWTVIKNRVSLEMIEEVFKGDP